MQANLYLSTLWLNLEAQQLCNFLPANMQAITGLLHAYMCTYLGTQPCLYAQAKRTLQSDSVLFSQAEAGAGSAGSCTQNQYIMAVVWAPTQVCFHVAAIKKPLPVGAVLHVHTACTAATLECRATAAVGQTPWL